MITQCCVIGCKNYTHDRKGKRLDNGVQFFSLPVWRQHQGQQISELTKRRRMAWVSAVRQPDITFNSIAQHFVCSQHFITGKPANEMLDSDSDWSPTLHLGHTGEVKASLCNTERSNRSTRRRRAVNSTASAAPAPQRPEADEAVPQPPPNPCDESDDASQVDEAGPEVDNTGEEQEINYYSRGNEDINRLLEDYRTVKEYLSQKQFDEQYFKDNDERVKYYTGLTLFDGLMGVLSAVCPLLKTHQKLSKFQMLVLTLMRLRLDWPNVHLAHMFCIDPTTAASIFKHTIDVLYGFSLYQTEKDNIFDGIPYVFEVFGKRSLIIDCFEIVTERPAQAFSQYKQAQTHTQKYLIGITPGPYGQVRYVSKGYEGALTDKTVTVLCGLLQKLQQGDLVLAERGFDIQESVGLMCAEVTEHGHLKEKDLEQTRTIAHLRTPVREAVDNVRNRFTMLSHTIPACFCLPWHGKEDLTWLDKIVHVCCIMTCMVAAHACEGDGPMRHEQRLRRWETSGSPGLVSLQHSALLEKVVARW